MKEKTLKERIFENLNPETIKQELEEIKNESPYDVEKWKNFTI